MIVLSTPFIKLRYYNGIVSFDNHTKDIVCIVRFRTKKYCRSGAMHIIHSPFKQVSINIVKSSSVHVTESQKGITHLAYHYQDVFNGLRHFPRLRAYRVCLSRNGLRKSYLLSPCSPLSVYSYALPHSMPYRDVTDFEII